jgi:hypothetical protein
MPGPLLTGHNAVSTADRHARRQQCRTAVGGCSGRADDSHYSESVVSLTAGDERFRDDRGAADPAVAAALAAYAAGAGTEQAALTALAAARLLVPIVAILADDPAISEPAGAGPAGREAAVPHSGGEKASEMAMPAIIGLDGRKALPAFTSVQALQRWQADARPVPVPASGVWQSAVQESCAVVVDIAGPVPIAVEGARLAALAADAPVPAMHEDPDVWQAAAAAAGEVAPGIRVRLSPPVNGLDLTLELAWPDGATEPVPAELASRIADALTARLAGRLRNGLAVQLQPPVPGGQG